MKKLIKLKVFGFSAAVFGQTNTTVVPFGLENQNGNGIGSLLSESGQTQELFRGSYLASSWDTRVAITGMAFRVDGGLSMEPTIPRVEIRFSTTSINPENMSLAYPSNKGVDESTVFFHDNVTLFGQGGQAVNPFDLRFTFDRPFLYDPKAGNLLISVTLTGSFLGGRQIDAHGYPNLAGSPVGYVGFDSGNQVVAFADVTQFSFIQVPEPSVKCLLLGGVMLVTMLTKRTR